MNLIIIRIQLLLTVLKEGKTTFKKSSAWTLLILLFTFWKQTTIRYITEILGFFLLNVPSRKLQKCHCRNENARLYNKKKYETEITCFRIVHAIHDTFMIPQSNSQYKGYPKSTEGNTPCHRPLKH